MNLYTKIKSLQKDVKLPSKKDLKDFRCEFDIWSSETDLYKNKEVENALKDLEGKQEYLPSIGYLYFFLDISSYPYYPKVIYSNEEVIDLPKEEIESLGFGDLDFEQSFNESENAQEMNQPANNQFDIF